MGGAKRWRTGRTPVAANNRPASVASEFKFAETEPGKTRWVRFDHRGNMPETSRHEMMLNTDLCLICANPSGTPVLASRDECCTWTPPEMHFSKFQQVMQNSAGGAYCGASQSPHSDENHKTCCHNTEWETCAGCPSVNSKMESFGGPAEGDILEFAGCEKVWRDAFRASWKKGTENQRIATFRSRH